jgi:choline dehydrogenase-like flavoprotein
MRPGRRQLYDVLIVGSGAGGGPLAVSLATAGLRVLVLEKGPRYERSEYDHATGIAPGSFVPPLAEDPHTVVTRKTPIALPTDLGWIATCVGGGTVHMGAYLYRFHPDDFRLRSRFGPYEEVADWPFDYDELEPWYSRAEWEVGVSGLAGTDPGEAPRSRPYPMPPLEAHPVADRLADACRKRGLHPFPTPRAINSRPYGGRPVCTYCPHCASYGCPVGARGSSQEALLSRAEATGRCTLLPRSMVREVLVDGDGRATGCVYLDEQGKEHRAAARVVCVCASAVESARLLLLSTSNRYPRGLANGNGLVGRHLQFHGVTTGRGRLPVEHLHAGERSSHPMIGLSVADHYFLPPGVSDLPKGGLLRFGRPQGEGVPVAPSPGQEELELFFEVFHDFLPNAATFVELDEQVRDRWGLPVARIHFDIPPHLARAGGFVLERAFELLGDLGTEALTADVVGGVSRYLVLGTCRAGDDVETSVVDGFCRTHEVPNLFVVDGSFMPTSGGAPPTLTILAQSFRVADHLLGHFRAGGFG